MDAKNKSVCKNSSAKKRQKLQPFSRQKLTKSRAFRLSSNISTGAAAHKLAEAGMLCNDIMPCTPAIDNGFDTLACVYGSTFSRVQVRGQLTCSGNGTRFRFSLLRRKASVGRGKNRRTIRRLRFTADDIDVFVFVHIRYFRFFIIPVCAVDLTKDWITFQPGCEWENAWHHLKTGELHDVA